MSAASSALHTIKQQDDYVRTASATEGPPSRPTEVTHRSDTAYPSDEVAETPNYKYGKDHACAHQRASSSAYVFRAR